MTSTARTDRERNTNRRSPRPRSRTHAALALIAVLLVAVLLSRAPLGVIAVYAVVGLASAAAYASDKRRAEAGDWRIPEARLHALDLAGGIIGGLLAQEVLRHKTSKPGFGIATAAIAAAHLLLLCGLALGLVDASALRDFL